jgi:hypothetical protein
MPRCSHEIDFPNCTKVCWRWDGRLSEMEKWKRRSTNDHWDIFLIPVSNITHFQWHFLPVGMVTKILQKKMSLAVNNSLFWEAEGFQRSYIWMLWFPIGIRTEMQSRNVYRSCITWKWSCGQYNKGEISEVLREDPLPSSCFKDSVGGRTAM